MSGSVAPDTVIVVIDSLTPHHWFQFADDTALVTATEEDNHASTA